MKTSIRRIALLIVIILTLITGFFSFAFREMEIEDHYGDLQNFYHKSRNGDLMILGEYDKIGIVDKTWKRIRIINSSKDTVDLYNWFYDKKRQRGPIILYRPNRKLLFDELDKEKISQKIEQEAIRKIISTSRGDLQ